MQQEINFSVHANSLEVYRERVLPELKGRKKQILDALIKLGGTATMYEIGQLLNLPLNHISGRFKELINAGKIDMYGVKEHHGNKFTIWKIK